jgi:hypothetical protein
MPNEEETFQELIKALLEFYTPRQVADWIEVSPASVRMWASGRNRPHPAFQKAIIPTLEAYLHA